MSQYLSVYKDYSPTSRRQKPASRPEKGGTAGPKHQFRPELLKPPPAPVWVHEKSLVGPSYGGASQSTLFPKGSEKWTTQQKMQWRFENDPNHISYQIYLRTYDAYLAKLASLREKFWDNVSKKKEAAAKPAEGFAPPAESQYDEVPVDAAALKRQNEAKSRRAAARRRQRAAKRQRDRQAKAESLETRVEIARLQNQLNRATGSNKAPKALPVGQKAASSYAAAAAKPARAGASSPRPAEVTLGQEASSGVPSLKRSNARSRRTERRRGMYLAPGRAPEVQSPPAPHASE